MHTAVQKYGISPYDMTICPIFFIIIAKNAAY